MVSPLLLVQLLARRGRETQHSNSPAEDPELGRSTSAALPRHPRSALSHLSGQTQCNSQDDPAHDSEQNVNGIDYAEEELEDEDGDGDGDAERDEAENDMDIQPRQTQIAIHDEKGVSQTKMRLRFFPRTDSSTSDWSFNPQPDAPGPVRRMFRKIKNFVFQIDPNGEEDGQFIPNYRYLPIISGVLSPFAILLEIPGLTEHWYVRTENNRPVEVKPNAPTIDAAMGLSMACALIANIALISRFLENRVKLMTYICMAFLILHDVINIVTVTAFGVIHRVNDGFTYGEAFWMCLCSTIFSVTAMVTLGFDLVTTPDFARSGSGLTRKQRSLVIMIMILLCYTALGSLVFSVLLDLSFQDGLYFTVVSIETIGFGDILPRTNGSKVFSIFYTTAGIINVGLVVNTTRETVIEAFENAYRKRAAEVARRRHEHKILRRQAREKRLATEKELREAGLPVYVPVAAPPVPKRTHGTYGSGRGGGGVTLAIPRTRHKMVLNEAGLEEWKRSRDAGEIHIVISPAPTLATSATEKLDQRLDGDERKRSALEEAHELGTGVTVDTEPPPDGEEKDDSYAEFRKRIKKEEKKEFLTKLTVAFTFFFTFWVVGAGIFVATEGWGFGKSLYFCWMAFSTIGYGDITPGSPAGRAIFVVWALMGVAAMTILIAVLSEAYGSRYKSALQKGSLQKAMRAFTQIKHENNAEAHPLHSQRQSLDRDELDGSDAATTAPSHLVQKFLDHTRSHLQWDAPPHDVFRHARTFHDYVRCFADHSQYPSEHPPKGLNELLGEIAQAEGMDDRMRQEMLGDDEVRKALFFANYEHVFKKLMDVAERAIDSIAAQDVELEKLVVVLKDQELRAEAAGKKNIGGCSRSRSRQGRRTSRLMPEGLPEANRTRGRQQGSQRASSQPTHE